jgi:hypothetical protein
MRSVLIILIATLLISCAQIPSANVYDISCTKHSEAKKKNYINVCDLSIEADNLGKQKNFHCYGEVTITNIMENGTTIKYDYGFLTSYKFGKEIDFEPKIYLPASISFPDAWQVTKVEKKWSKCEKQN